MKNCRLFIGGLSTDTTEKDLFNYFRQLGQVKSCKLVYDKSSRLSKGFGFVTMKDKSTAVTILKSSKHLIKGRLVDVSPGIGSNLELPESHHTKCLRRLFIGGIKKHISQDDLWNYFSGFGTVLNLFKIADPITNVQKNYGYVEFEDVDVSTAVLHYNPHIIKDCRLSIELHRKGSDERATHVLPESKDRADLDYAGFSNHQLSKLNHFPTPSQTLESIHKTKPSNCKNAIICSGRHRTTPITSQLKSDLYCGTKLAQSPGKFKLGQDYSNGIHSHKFQSSSWTNTSRSSESNSLKCPQLETQPPSTDVNTEHPSNVDALLSLKKTNKDENYSFRMESLQSFNQRARHSRLSIKHHS